MAGLGGCAGSGPLDLQDATTFWRQNLAKLAHGTVQRGDGRGCVQTSTGHYACTAYVRNAADSLSTGTDFIGTVVSNANTTTINAHHATSAQIQHWFSLTGGAGSKY